MLKIGVLVSGGGSNLQAIIDGTKDGSIDGQVSLIISNKEEVYGLVRGRNAGIESIFVDSREFANSKDYNLRLVEELQKRDIDLIVLAGYLKILSGDFIKAYKDRIINIHPSLIPSFCGDGYYGQRVHKAVLDYGCKVTGATVHFVDEGTDTGPIILQKCVEVRDDDTVEILQERVLKIEHEILPQAVSLFCQGKIELKGRKTRIVRGD